MSVDLGDLPTWVSAITTAAALGAAIVAARVAYKVYEIESGRDRQSEGERRAREQEERRSQAAKVAAWFSADHGGAVVYNASNLPIYDARVFFYSFAGLSLGEAIELREQRPFWTDVHLVPPGELQPVEAPDEFRAADIHHAFVGVDFRDAAGNLWSRGDQGELRERT